MDAFKPLIDATPPEHRVSLLCELNAIEQVVNVAQTTVVQDAWARGQALTLHGWVYGLSDGLIKDMHMTVDSQADLERVYRGAVGAEFIATMDKRGFHVGELKALASARSASSPRGSASPPRPARPGPAPPPRRPRR